MLAFGLVNCGAAIFAFLGVRSAPGPNYRLISAICLAVIGAYFIITVVTLMANMLAAIRSDVRVQARVVRTKWQYRWLVGIVKLKLGDRTVETNSVLNYEWGQNLTPGSELEVLADPLSGKISMILKVDSLAKVEPWFKRWFSARRRRA